jgi:hypothetical protein
MPVRTRTDLCSCASTQQAQESRQTDTVR